MFAHILQNDTAADASFWIAQKRSVQVCYHLLLVVGGTWKVWGEGAALFPPPLLGSSVFTAVAGSGPAKVGYLALPDPAPPDFFLSLILLV